MFLAVGRSSKLGCRLARAVAANPRRESELLESHRATDGRFRRLGSRLGFLGPQRPGEDGATKTGMSRLISKMPSCLHDVTLRDSALSTSLSAQ